MTAPVSFKPGQKILVTGGAGFVGSHVVDRAMAEGASVTVLDNLYTGKSINFQHHRTNPRFSFVNHNVILEFPAPILHEKWDYIFHLACAASPVHYQNDPIGTTLTCVNGTNNVLKLAMASDCPVLIASTSEVYGDPLVHPQVETYWGNTSCTGIRACYDEGKRCAEALCFDYNRHYGVKIRVARIFNTYGPRMCADDGRIVSNFVVQALTNRDITIYGTGEYTRSFQYVSDLVEGFWRLIQHPSEIGPVNLGNPVEFTVKEAADLISSMVPGTTSQVTYLPAAKDDPKQRKPDITKAKTVLNGWTPAIPFAEGLKSTILSFRSQITPPISDRILIVCNPLLDISSHVDKAFLDKYRLKAGAAGLCEADQQPIYAELEARADVKYIPGGSGLNTARVAQWLSQAPNGRFVSYAGCIADDANGKLMKKAAEQEGVNMALQYSSDATAPTGTCAVCIVGKERALLANLGAANNLNASHLRCERLLEILDDVNLIYLTGFTLTNSTALLHAVYERASRHRAQIAMNLSAPFIMQFFGNQVNEVLPFLDIIFGNEDEAEAFAVLQKFAEPKNLKQVAIETAKLAKKSAGPRLVVFTAGKHPAVWATSEGESGEVAVPLIDPSKIVDTNGAGDSFLGGFFAGYAQRKPINKCILAGHYAAGVVIQHDGCTYPAKPDYQL